MCQVKGSGIVPTSNEIKDNLKVINKIGYLENKTILLKGNNVEKLLVKKENL